MRRAGRAKTPSGPYRECHGEDPGVSILRSNFFASLDAVASPVAAVTRGAERESVSDGQVDSALRR